ncbi:hypothetical protein [Flavobacterium subsaxonicum]|uniref:Uncharacterized protein n=1 Tax=Flavobacterium subsaxonicum WB 4.1-42 = DSM 21790 TaxID=1121898 RepID=A0A0A2MIC2_9FLAO|nr:hypothetical protein [Flavobacterium subsaxonicum]KGO91336.1 hypothetical protein Q766_18090 [Flavobacterium subsaxonicum WB 4.1-42 = DSM 21790]
MREFKFSIRIVPPLYFIFRYVLSIVGTAILSIFIVYFLKIDSKDIYFSVLYLILVLIALKFSKKISTVKCNVCINEKAIIFSYNFFFFYKISEFLYVDIIDYDVDQNQHFKFFKIFGVDRDIKISIYNDSVNETKVLDEIVCHFKKQLQKYGNNIDVDLRIGKSIYNSRFSKLVAYFLAIVLIVIPILVIIYNRYDKVNFGTLTVLYSTAIYFIIRVYLHRNKS